MSVEFYILLKSNTKSLLQCQHYRSTVYLIFLPNLKLPMVNQIVLIHLLPHALFF